MPLKILHTSDWHLGKKLYKYDRLDEQKIFLDFLFEKIKRESFDLLIIAGDIFDTPFPPTEALRVYFDFLKKLTDETKASVAIVAGNHDSGRFLEAPLPFLRERKIFISGQIFPEKSTELLFKIRSPQGEEAEIFLLPFFRHHDLEDIAKFFDIPFDEENLSLFFESFFKKVLPPKKLPRFFVGHHHFGKSEGEGSELGLSLSNLKTIPLDVLKPYFDYLALGHIHKDIILSKNPYAIYSGSPLPWRFSEKNEKSFFEIKIENGTLDVQKIPIPSIRPLFRLNLTEENFKNEIEEKVSLKTDSLLAPFAEVQVHLKTPSSHLQNEISEILKEKGIELLSYSTSILKKEDFLKEELHWKNLSIEEIFNEYYKKKFDGENCPSDLKETFLKYLQLSKEGSL